MRSLRRLPWLAAGVLLLQVGSACVADGGPDNLNPQPLPPGDPAPSRGEEDEKGDMGAGGSTGAPNQAADSGADGGADGDSGSEGGGGDQ